MIAPHFNRSTSHLGNSESVFFHVSCDAKKDWNYGIFHNSRYGIFCLGKEKGKMKVELLSRGMNCPKFRKATVKNESHAINKILQWMGNIVEDSVFMN